MLDVLCYKNLLGGGKAQKIRVIYRGWNDRKLEVNDGRIEHITSLSLSKFDVLNLFVATLVFDKKNPIRRCASPELKKLDSIFEDSDIIMVSPSGANIGIYQDERLLSMLLLAIAKGKQTVFHYCTVGKSKSLIFDLIARKVLRKSELFLREQKSMEYVKQLGIKGASFGYDTAFRFKRPQISLSDDIERLTEDKPIVLIITQLHTWHPNYIASTADDEIIREIVIPSASKLAKENNKKIILLPHIIEDTELQFLNMVYDWMPDNIKQRVSVAQISSVNDYDYIISKAEIVITMRYHGVVVSAKNCCPFLAVAYENKILEVANYVGCPENVITFSEMQNDKEIFDEKLQCAWKCRQLTVRKLKEFNKNLI